MVLAKSSKRIKAIGLRKKGYSYNEIRKVVSASKSSLSLWLKEIKLTDKQKQRFIEKQRQNQLKARRAVIGKRIKITKEIVEEAKREIPKINNRDLWFIGTALYWAEGAKQKENNVSQIVQIGNSDPKLIRLLLKWFLKICKIPIDSIQFRIAIHETGNEAKARAYWSKVLSIPLNKFNKSIIKKHKVKTNRIIRRDYHGLLEIRINKSTNLNRKIYGWIEGICENIAGSSNW